MQHKTFISEINPSETKAIILKTKDEMFASVWSCSEKGTFASKIKGKSTFKKNNFNKTFPQILIHTVNKLGMSITILLKNTGKESTKVTTSVILN